MVKAYWHGNEVIAVSAYVNEAASRYVWIIIRRPGTTMNMCVPMGAVTLEEER